MSSGSPGPLEDGPVRDPLVHRRVREMERLGADDPGHDRVAGDPVAAALHRQRPRQAEDARLRRRVAGLAEAAERPCDRRHVDDPAPLALLHVRPDRLGAVEAAREVDAQVALPEVGVLVVELADVVERAGVVDQDVDRAELLDDAVDRLLHLVAVGDVALDRGRAAAERLDLLRRRLGVDDPLRLRHLREHAVRLGGLGRFVRLDLDIGDDDVGACARERQRIRAAEAARAAGDERDPSREIDLDCHEAILRW